MKRFFSVGLLFALTALLIAGCGRRLPEEGVSSAAPTAVAMEEETVATEETVPEVEATEEADPVAATTEEVTEAITTTEEAESETAAADDPVAQAIAAGDLALGQQVFNQQYTTSVGPWICASCHSVDESQMRLVGPGLWGIAEYGEERIAESGDADVVEYVHNSIVNPGAYIVPADSGGPYPENLMPPNYAEVLTEEELDAVVAYVLSLQ